MVNKKNHKIFIGVASIVILIIGLYLGVFLTVNLEITDLQAINIGLTFASIILLLIIGGMVLDVRETLEAKTRKKMNR